MSILVMHSAFKECTTLCIIIETCVTFYLELSTYVYSLLVIRSGPKHVGLWTDAPTVQWKIGPSLAKRGRQVKWSQNSRCKMYCNTGACVSYGRCCKREATVKLMEAYHNGGVQLPTVVSFKPPPIYPLSNRRLGGNQSRSGHLGKDIFGISCLIL
jgi:hypothetical protein